MNSDSTIGEVAAIEILSCCGGICERRCGHCEKAFIVPTHLEDHPVLVVQLQMSNGVVYCPHCGAPTTMEHNVRPQRTRAEIREERESG